MEDPYKPKKKVSLRVKDLRLVNLTLLSKCGWRVLWVSQLFWKNIVSFRYVAQVSGSLMGGSVARLRKDSYCLKDVPLLGSTVDHQVDLFIYSCYKVVGDRLKTRFFRDVWAGHNLLCVSFDRLFLIS